METIKNIAILDNQRAPGAFAPQDSGQRPPSQREDQLCPEQIKKETTSPVPRIFAARDVLAAFSAEFLGEHLCRMWILNKIHGTDPPRCPRCGEPVAAHMLHSFWDNRRVRCGKCRKMFTALTGTFLSGCHMDFREIFLLAVLLGLDLADAHIAQILHMSAENVRLWRLKLKYR